MQLTIHRGTHEIGGSCIEVSSNSGNTRLVIDIGLPLVNPDKSPFDWNKYKNYSINQLLNKKILPSINGLYNDSIASISAVLLSHAHLDHYGLLRFVQPEIDLYMSKGTKSLAEVSNIFLGANVHLDNIKTFEMWQPYQIGEFTITPYLVDHSSPDAVAFFIEADGKRIFYTGDFRGHGRKAILLDRLIKNPPPNIDYLIMEGSMLGREEGFYPDENAVEQAIYETIQYNNGPYYIFTSSQNLDRLVSIYRAARRCNKILVIDLYTAFVLDKLNILSAQIPQFSWEGIRVLYAHYHAGKLAEQDVKLLYKYKASKIEFVDILNNPGDKVMLAKDSQYYRQKVIAKIQEQIQASAIYSMWHGYLERGNLREFLQVNNIPLTEIHTSGHAYIKQLQEIVNALKPKHILPIHTFYPEKYHEMFTNIMQLNDGETLNIV